MTFFDISDSADSRLEAYRLVRDRDRANANLGLAGGAVGPGSPGGFGNSGGPRAGLFIGETSVVIEAMLREPGRTISILAAKRHESRVREMLERAVSPQQPDVYLVPDEIVEPLTGFNLHRGLLAIGRRPAARPVESILPSTEQDATLLCVESVNNIDNIGQLFRIAAAFGCCGVLLSPDCHDPLYRKSLRVSCGCALLVPHARSVDWAGDLRAIHAKHGFTLIGATGKGDVTLEQLVARPWGASPAPRRLALLVGAEYEGLSEASLNQCHARARIPMAPGVDSLNVGVAAAVFLSRLAPNGQR